MTGEQSLRLLEVIELLREMIAGCFTPGDGIFAGDELCKEQAKVIRKIALANSVILKEIQSVALTFLLTHGYGYRGDHVNKQFADLTAFFGSTV